MIKTKEIFNTENGQEFVSKDYLQDRACLLINFDINDVVKKARAEDPLADM